MSGRALRAGKLPPALLAELLGGRDTWPAELLLGPAPGEDACAIELERGVLVAATDPITLTGSEVGAYAVEINANDVAVMGVRPRWFLACVLLPEGSDEADVRELFGGIREGLARLGATLVGGHTEVTPAVRQPVVVGQMLGHSETGRVVRTGGVTAGDVVVQVGLAPVEGAAVLAVEAAERLGTVPAEVLARARAAIRDPGISIVESALRAADHGATALHDPTEGGLAAGLHELAAASGVAIEVDRDAALWFEPGLHICEALGADPWATLASGALLAAFAPGDAVAATASLEAAGCRARIIGRALAGSGVHCLGTGDPIPLPARDEVARLLP